MAEKAGVRILSPPGAIAPTGTWSLGTRAGDFVFVAGMRGIDPASNALVEGGEARIRQAFVNMQRSPNWKAPVSLPACASSFT